MATAAAAVVAKARRDVAEHLMRAGAVSPDSAVACEPGRHVHRRALARWQRAGVVQEAEPGRWYLNLPAYADARARRRRILAVSAVGVLVATAAAMMAH